MHSITLAPLLLILSTTSFTHAATVSPTYINETVSSNPHHQLWARQDLDIPIVCPLNIRGQSPLADIFNHFGLLSNGDVRLTNNYSFPIAVNGSLQTTKNVYSINTDHAGSCAVDDTSDIYSYGLDNPGTTTLVSSTAIYGNVLLNNTSAVNVVPTGENCALYSTDRSVIDYEKVKTGLYAASRYLASLPPDLTMGSTGLVTSIAEPVNPRFRVFTVNTCYPPATDSTTCSSWSLNQLSTADMFGKYTSSVWNGPTNPEVYEDAETIVINVPITHRRPPFVFYTDPSLGFKNCKTIFNFYAVNSAGEFIESDTLFTLSTYTRALTFEGFILAPDANVSNYYSKLAGKLFSGGLQDSSGMIDFTCDAKAYTACFPVQDYIETSSTSTDESSTSTDESSTSSDESSTSSDESSTSSDESSTSTDESSTSDCTSGTTTETVTTDTTTTEASITTTDYTTTTTTEYTSVASTTVIVTQSATSTVFTTTTSTFTTTYTSDHSTITAVVTTTAPVFVPVENSWNDEREGRRHGDWDDRRHYDWKNDDEY